MCYLNINENGTLESSVVYQNLRDLMVQVAMEAGPKQRDVMILTELHFDVLSRIDNARAPSGTFVEYDKTGYVQKFAARFK